MTMMVFVARSVTNLAQTLRSRGIFFGSAQFIDIFLDFLVLLLLGLFHLLSGDFRCFGSLLFDFSYFLLGFTFVLVNLVVSFGGLTACLQVMLFYLIGSLLLKLFDVLFGLLFRVLNFDFGILLSVLHFGFSFLLFLHYFLLCFFLSLQNLTLSLVNFLLSLFNLLSCFSLSLLDLFLCILLG